MRYKRSMLFCASIALFMPFFFLYAYLKPLLSALYVLMHYAPKNPIFEEKLIHIKEQKAEKIDQSNYSSATVEKIKNDQQSSIATTQESTVHSSVVAPTIKKNSLSLNNLAQGFQTYANHRKQQKTQEQTVEITEVRFLEKLIQSVLTQLRINRQNLLPYATQEYELHCAVSLERSGILKQIVISKTSGNIFLDSLIKKIIQDASGAFPSVPQSIKKDPYMLIFDLKIGSYVSLQILLPK